MHNRVFWRQLLLNASITPISIHQPGTYRSGCKHDVTHTSGSSVPRTLLGQLLQVDMGSFHTLCVSVITQGRIILLCRVPGDVLCGCGLCRQLSYRGVVPGGGLCRALNRWSVVCAW